MPQAAEREGVLQVAGVDEAREREEALGAARVARDEDELAVLGALGVHLEEVLDLRRLPLLVGAEDGHVEVVARVSEVVVVAAEEGGLELGREHHADVVVLLVTVEAVLGAPVERHDLAAEALGLEALRLEGRDGRLALLARLRRRGARLHRALDLGGDVFHGHEDAHAHAGHGELLRRRLGVEPVAHVVVLGRAQALEGAEGHVVVGEDEAVLGDEGGARPRVHGGEAEVVQKRRGRLEPVALLDELERRVVVGPHALVGERGDAG